MQYALLNGQKSEARRGVRGECPLRGHPTVAKRGPRVMHHSAHAAQELRSVVGERNRVAPGIEESLARKYPEVPHTAAVGEIHRPAIKTPTGIVIEVQPPGMTVRERESREAFYQNLVWILDKRGFESRFEIPGELPDPASEMCRKPVWWPAGPSPNRHLYGPP